MNIFRNQPDWHIGQGKTLHLNRTFLMGILNVTPDSFSDGGQYADAERAVSRAYEMARQGADIIDVGGQSTRPGHIPVPPEEEWRRIEPVLKRLCADNALIISKLTEFFRRRTAECIADGIPQENLCLDPGVGFGKSYEQNLSIAKRFSEICMGNYPVLAAASRKRVIGRSGGDLPVDQRLPGTIAYHTACILCGANIIRVHDIPEAAQAAKVADAILNPYNE